MPSLSDSDKSTVPLWLGKRTIVTALPGFLARSWCAPVISLIEYAVALAAVGNISVLAYQLAYWSISISSIAVDSGSLSQTHSPFLWSMLVVPAHVLSCWALRLRFAKGDMEPSRHTSSFPQLVEQRVCEEFTPCAYGRPLVLKSAEEGEHAVMKTVLRVVLDWLSSLGGVGGCYIWNCEFVEPDFY